MEIIFPPGVLKVEGSPPQLENPLDGDQPATNPHNVTLILQEGSDGDTDAPARLMRLVARFPNDTNLK
jgi:hypothetical protein